MNWTEVNVYTTTEGIEPVCGRLLGVGVTGFAIKDAKDFEDFLNDKTGNWDYIDDDLMNLKNCETCVTFYLADNSQGADMLAMVRSEMAELAALDALSVSFPTSVKRTGLTTGSSISSPLKWATSLL